ncbi:MAG: hypothetical protein V7K46_15655 [Nostoc sp.]
MEIVCVIIRFRLDHTYRIIERWLRQRQRRSHHRYFSESVICQKMRSH